MIDAAEFGMLMRLIPVSELKFEEVVRQNLVGWYSGGTLIMSQNGLCVHEAGFPGLSSLIIGSRIRGQVSCRSGGNGLHAHSARLATTSLEAARAMMAQKCHNRSLENET